MIDLIKPNWPAPTHIKAYTTTRIGGYSTGPYAELNLATHVGDNPEDVETNRLLLQETLHLPTMPLWLTQVHGTKIISADSKPADLIADGSFAKKANKICVVLTADCLPVLLTNIEGTIVAALHCGWRGIFNGIIEEGVAICQRKNLAIMAWLGPAIGPESYEVNEDFKHRFCEKWPESELAFKKISSERYLANLYLLAEQRLRSQNVSQIFKSDLDTVLNKDQFYSYRRDGEKTGRMATLIWMAK